MYSGLSSVVMPAGLPSPEEDVALIKKVVANLSDPNETYGGTSTYWQSVSDLTSRHYRFKSLIAPSDVYFAFDDYNFAEGQPVRLIKRIDRYAQKGWSGDVIPHLVKIHGDISTSSPSNKEKSMRTTDRQKVRIAPVFFIFAATLLQPAPLALADVSVQKQEVLESVEKVAPTVEEITKKLWDCKRSEVQRFRVQGSEVKTFNGLQL